MAADQSVTVSLRGEGVGIYHGTNQHDGNNTGRRPKFTLKAKRALYHGYSSRYGIGAGCEGIWR
jgi:hypothetical protein